MFEISTVVNGVYLHILIVLSYSLSEVYHPQASSSVKIKCQSQPYQFLSFN